VQFLSKKSFKQVHELLPGCHLEAAKGRPDQAANYCKKDGDFHEHGIVPTTPGEQGENERKRYQRAWELAKSGDIEEIDSDIRMRHYGTIKRIRADYQQVPDSLPTLDFHWYTGASGTGKSRAAREENPGYFVKNKNKWWCGYVDQPCVIIEEWNPEIIPALNHMLKEWLDHHPFCAETKGSSAAIRPPKIIVTSNYTLEECFGSDRVGLLEPIKRRVTVREF
jgi:hypothetical protein